MKLKSKDCRSTDPLTLFKSNLRERYGNKFTFNDADYVNGRTDIDFQCSLHGQFTLKPMYILKVHCPCAKCRREATVSQSLSRFYTRVSKFDSMFDYSQMDIEALIKRKAITIICKKHGSFKMLVTTHINSKYGCKSCADEAKELEEKVVKVEECTNKEDAKKNLEHLNNSNPLMKWK